VRWLCSHGRLFLFSSGNLLLLYIKHGYFDLAADVLADNAHLHATCLTQELYDYLEAVIESQVRDTGCVHHRLMVC